MSISSFTTVIIEILQQDADLIAFVQTLAPHITDWAPHVMGSRDGGAMSFMPFVVVEQGGTSDSYGSDMTVAEIDSQVVITSDFPPDWSDEQMICFAKYVRLAIAAPQAVASAPWYSATVSSEQREVSTRFSQIVQNASLLGVSY